VCCHDQTPKTTHYRTPLSKDDWTGMAALVAIGTAGTAVAVVAIRRRDVGR
jgi:hypothetical protein